MDTARSITAHVTPQRRLTPRGAAPRSPGAAALLDGGWVETVGAPVGSMDGQCGMVCVRWTPAEGGAQRMLLLPAAL